MTHDTKGNMSLIPAVIRPDGNDLTLDWDFENRITAAEIGNDGTVPRTTGGEKGATVEGRLRPPARHH